MTERGEQVMPTATSGATRMPRRPVTSDAALLSARVTLLPISAVRNVAWERENIDEQHWIVPVLQELEIPEGLPLRATESHRSE